MSVPNRRVRSLFRHEQTGPYEAPQRPGPEMPAPPSSRTRRADEPPPVAMVLAPVIGACIWAAFFVWMLS